MERKIGTVVHVVKDRGYWFILFEGRRVFCHISNWSELEFPAVGDRVSFELGSPRKNTYQQQAVSIRPEPNAGIQALATGLNAEAHSDYLRDA
jgi:cold shock CspA family protein